MLDDIWKKVLEELPKALFGLLIPLAQYLWKQYKQGGAENEMRSLRSKIADLSVQRDSLRKIAGIPNADRALRDLEIELQAAVAKLAATGGEPPPRRHPSERPAAARWFLAYTPSGAFAWIFHTLFYANVAIVLLGLLGLLLEWRGTDSAYGLLGLAIFLIPAVIFRSVALRLDGAKNTGASGWERVPNAKPPSGRLWLPTMLFWLAVLTMPFVWIGAAMDANDQFNAEAIGENLAWAIPFTVFLFLFATSALGWARSLPEPREPLGKLRSGLLLFVPSRPAGWLAQLSWYLGWMAALLVGYPLFSGSEDSPGIHASVLAVIVVYLLCSWKWAQSCRPRSAAADAFPNIPRARSSAAHG